MKFIAARDFSQGPHNPLKLPDGSMHVAKGTVFYIGGDTPCDKYGAGLNPDDLKVFQSLTGSGAFFAYDSEEGRQILQDIERAKTPRQRRAEEFQTLDRRELVKMEDKQLAEWQSRFESDEPQWRLAEHEWQRRLTAEQVHATIRGARWQAYFGIAGAIIGAIVGVLLTLVAQAYSH